MGAAMKRLALLFAIALAAPAAVILGAPGVAQAAEEPEAFARVVVDSAELRTGPGSCRVLYTSHRGETFALDGRPGTGFWLASSCRTGGSPMRSATRCSPSPSTRASPKLPRGPGFFARLRSRARAGLAIIGGEPPAIPVRAAPRARSATPRRVRRCSFTTVALEGYIGDGLTAEARRLLYGGGVGPLRPELGRLPLRRAGGGGLSIRPNADPSS